MINKVGRFFLAKGVKFVWLFHTNIGSRLNNNRKEILIGVQHRGLVPTVVPRGASRSNSGP